MLFRSTALTAPEGFTEIPDYCFQYCESLATLEIPVTVNSLGTYAFAYCTGLTEVTLPVELSGFGIFTGTSNVTAIHYTVKSDGIMPDRTGNSGETYYGETLEYASGGKLASVDFADGVTHIGSWAFYKYYGSSTVDVQRRAALKTVELPGSVESVGENAFAYNQEAVFNGLPESLTEAGAWAFNGCKGLTVDGLPAGFTTAGNGAFGYSGITALTVPAGFVDIPESCFQYCASLETLEISKTVNTLGSNAFGGCTGLKTVTFTGDAPTIDNTAFSSVTAVVWRYKIGRAHV